ncbi:MAG: insulinase family protein [Capsulimonadaceae bacterium]|nr:insulinase family protein [Capsulimonadaceae bacterium]
MTLIHGFELLEERFIAELNIKATLYRHAGTGAELLSLEADDENKAFNITFRTPPTDSTGVPHILEHSVLCGSRKYRSKEPFIELVKGSLKTFVNAMTGGEATYYPVASTNLQDFYNLIDVYLDCVLHPLLTEQAFHQEGWRYDLESEGDELTYKGVVFNEMKGYYASPDLHLQNRMQQTIMPDTIFAHDSGGEPSCIPNLSYSDFVKFHERYYHPSNSRILFYGDDPPVRRLATMNEWLSEFDRREIDSRVALQPRFSEPRSFVFPYPAGEEGAAEAKSHIAVSWLIEGGLDAAALLAHEILAYALIRSSAAPLRKALLDSGLGEEVVGGLSDGPQMMFSAGLKGVSRENCDAVQALVLETLGRLAVEGIDPEMIAAALNTVEFSLRENNTGSFPKGLSIGFRALQFWLYDADPLGNVAFEEPLNAVKEAAKSGRYFSDLIQTSLLANQHRVTVIVEPDPEMSERENRIERERLDRERAAMSPERIAEIIAETHELRLKQETPDSPEVLAAIPTLTLADLDSKIKTTPTDECAIGDGTLFYHDLATSGIVYLDLGFDLHNVPFDLLPYIPLLGSALTQLGAAGDDSVRLIQRIGQKTGGIWTSPFASAVYGSSIAASRLFLRAKALPSQASDLLAILSDILTAVRLDNRERLRQMVLERKAYYESSLAGSAAGYVSARLGSRFGESGSASAKMGGIDAYFFTRDLVSRIDNDWAGVEADLRRLLALLVNQQATIVNVTLDAKHWEDFAPALTEFVQSLPSSATSVEAWQAGSGPRYEGLTIPTQVNAVGKAANLYETGFERDGSAAVVTKYLRTTWLWEQVRMRGGAYGANCSFDPRSGILSFSSSQDPNVAATLAIYDKTSAFLRNVSLTDHDVTRTIIGVVSDLDFYELPDARGYSAMLRRLIGETDERRQLVRDQVLATSQQSFRAFADVLDAAKEQSFVVAMGSNKAIEEAARSLPFQVTPVL